MANPVAGPSQPNPLLLTPASTNPVPPQDARRRMEADIEIRRSKQTRPPLPPPHVLSTLVPDSPAFTDLMKTEQKLDWTLVRKKAEINDSLGRPQKVKRTLRVFLSNTAHDQQWQKDMEASAEQPDVNSGKGIAGWVLRVEGRLLDSGNVRLDKTRPKFSTFIRSAVIELDNRTAPTYPEGNTVEWHPQPGQPDLDGFEVLRRGDVNVECRILLHIAHQPERFKILAPLSDLIDLQEGTRSEVISALWKYVKVVGAQDKDDVTVIKPIGGLEKITTDSLQSHQLPELANRFLTHPEPVQLRYTIQTDRDFNLHHKCFDIPIEIDDPGKSKMSAITTSFEGKEGKEIQQLEDKVAELAYFARDTKQKRDFLESFAADPQAFIQKWLAAQARDLDSMLGYQVGLGGNGGSVTEEDLRRSDLFAMPWVDEAITVHQASRMEAERRR